MLLRLSAAMGAQMRRTVCHVGLASLPLPPPSSADVSAAAATAAAPAGQGGTASAGPLLPLPSAAGLGPSTAAPALAGLAGLAARPSLLAAGCGGGCGGAPTAPAVVLSPRCPEACRPPPCSARSASSSPPAGEADSRPRPPSQLAGRPPSTSWSAAVTRPATRREGWLSKKGRRAGRGHAQAAQQPQMAQQAPLHIPEIHTACLLAHLIAHSTAPAG